MVYIRGLTQEPTATSLATQVDGVGPLGVVGQVDAVWSVLSPAEDDPPLRLGALQPAEGAVADHWIIAHLQLQGALTGAEEPRAKYVLAEGLEVVLSEVKVGDDVTVGEGPGFEGADLVLDHRELLEGARAVDEVIGCDGGESVGIHGEAFEVGAVRQGDFPDRGHEVHTHVELLQLGTILQSPSLNGGDLVDIQVQGLQVPETLKGPSLDFSEPVVGQAQGFQALERAEPSPR